MPGVGAETAAVLLGLASAAFWGASDFSGGLVSKESSAISVVVTSQCVGTAILGVLLLVFGEPLPSAGGALWAAAAGIVGGIALVPFYRALADGRMGVVAPVGGMIGAVVPVIAAFFIDGPPAALKLAGFGLALAAVWLVSGGDGVGPVRLRELGMPVLAGIGFGLFFVLINQVPDTTFLWALTVARVASVASLSGVALVSGQARLPAARHMPLVALVGVFDTTANALYLLAARAARFDVAAVLGSLYPGGTVLLAWLILRERLTRWQWLGVAAALAAIALIAV